MPGDTLNATLTTEAPYDEMFGADGLCRPQYQTLCKRLDEIPREELNRRQHAADLSFLHQGVTFTVHHEDRILKDGVVPAEREEFRRRIEAAPRNYIAQPALALWTQRT